MVLAPEKRSDGHFPLERPAEDRTSNIFRASTFPAEASQKAPPHSMTPMSANLAATQISGHLLYD